MVGNHQTSIYKWLFGVPGITSPPSCSSRFFLKKPGAGCGMAGIHGYDPGSSKSFHPGKLVQDATGMWRQMWRAFVSSVMRFIFILLGQWLTF